MINRVITYHFRTALRYHPWKAWCAITGVILTTLTGQVATPLAVAYILETIQHGNATLTALTPALVIFAAARIYTNLIGWRLNAYFLWSMQVSGEEKLLAHVHEKLMQHSLTFHSNHMSGAMVSRATKFVSSFVQLWDMAILNLIPTAATIIASIIIAFFVFPPLGLAMLVATILYVFVARFGSKKRRQLVKATSEAHSKATGILADSIGNIYAVKSFSNTSHEKERMQYAAKIWKQRGMDSLWYFLKISTLWTAIMSTMAIVVAVMSVYAAERHFLSLAFIYLAFTLSLNLVQRLWEINSIFKSYYTIIGNSEEMLDILEQRPSIVDQPDAKALKVSQGEVVFQKVNFVYEPENHSPIVVQDLSLTIPAGQKLGIVGHSGAGKTTLSKLLLRFVEPSNGRILIDEQDITQVTQDSLHEAIAYVPQEPLLFHRSLRDNIAYGKQDATDDEMIAAAKKAHAWEFIKDLPDQLDTIVGERGVKLSGGQRQRIAIARAIIKQAPILLLDEATSALDSESEKLIQESLNDLMTRSTTIAIAHRLSTLQKMHRIIVLDRGRLVEDGTHAELLEKNGIYASLWAHQSGGFIAE